MREAWYSNHSGNRSNCAVISRIGRPVCSVSTTSYLREWEIYERRELFVTREGGLICSLEFDNVLLREDHTMHRL